MLVLYRSPEHITVLADQPATAIAGRLGYEVDADEDRTYSIRSGIFWPRNGGDPTRANDWYASVWLHRYTASRDPANDQFALPPHEALEPVLDAFLELRAQGLVPGLVYTVPGPLPAVDAFWDLGDPRRPSPKVRRPRANPAAQLHVVRSRADAPRPFVTLVLYAGGTTQVRATAELMRTSPGRQRVRVEVRDALGTRSDGLHGWLRRSGDVRWSRAWRYRDDTGVRERRGKAAIDAALEVLGPLVDWAIAQLAADLRDGQYTVSDAPDLARIATELGS